MTTLKQKSIYLGMILAVLILAMGYQRNYAQAPGGSVSPEKIEITLKPGDCSTAPITFKTGASAIPTLDVLFIIDVTSSMSPVIHEVVSDASEIASDIRALVPDVNFALGTLSDYPLLYGGDLSDYPWRLDQPLTTDMNLIQTKLSGILLGNGGDGPESYLRALEESRSIGWRDGSRRIVIFFGDSLPHDPDPGKDEMINTADDLTYSDVAAHLNEDGITVLTVQTEEFDVFYKDIAKTTSGDNFLLSSVDQIPQAIKDMMTKTVSTIKLVRLAPATSYVSWIKADPENFSGVGPNESHDFTTQVCAPSDATPKDYEFPVTVRGDGASLGQVKIIVHVLGESVPAVDVPGGEAPVVSEPGAAPATGGLAAFFADFPWWVLLLLLLLLLLLWLLWWLLHRSKAQRSTSSGPTARGGGGTEGPSLEELKTRERSGRDITHGRPTPPPKR